MRAVVETMGTALSLVIDGTDSTGADDARAALDEVTAIFAASEQRLSLYDDRSELSRVASGDLALDATSEALRSMYAEALEWRALTGGAFTPHRPDGVIDLDGIVKSAAMREAADRLVERQFESWCLNVGGDVMVRGVRADSSPWVLGVVDPHDRSRMICSMHLHTSRSAAATSGIAERGEHIWRTVDTDEAFVQVTVLSSDIVLCDVLATAIMSGGRTMLDAATDRCDIDVLTIGHAGTLTATPGIRSLLSRA